MLNQTFVSLFLILFCSTVQANTLTLHDYYDQVISSSPGVQSNRDIADGALAGAQGGDLVYIPRLTFDGNLTRDERLFTTSFLGGKTSSNNMTFGLKKTFDFGLDAALLYGITNNTTTDLTPLIFPGGVNNYTLAQSELDLTLNLWRNFWGKETRAQSTIDEGTELKSHYDATFAVRTLLANAESAYFQLAVARESVRLLREMVERANTLLKFNTKRVNQHLTDRADLLQAQAALQQRQLDLVAGVETQRTSQLSFNTLRNNPVSEVNDEIASVSVQDILALNLPARAETSDDIKSAEQDARVASARSELELQKAQPTFYLKSVVAYNGVDRYLSPATSEAFTANHPEYMVEAVLNFPIYFWETAQIRAGRVKQELGAESKLGELRLENNQKWEDLTRRFAQLKDQLKLTDDLVNMQQEKLKYEKYRFNLGRTTTYQVITFEQDYDSAVVARLKTEQAAIDTYTQLKTYATGPVQGASL
jgi:outer membrane protein TolC